MENMELPPLEMPFLAPSMVTIFAFVIHIWMLFTVNVILISYNDVGSMVYKNVILPSHNDIGGKGYKFQIFWTDYPYVFEYIVYQV